MRTTAAKLIACALVIPFLFMPADVSAKEKRGAELFITQIDGRQSRGELIAVKPDSLLLLWAGKDLSIPLADIKAVRIVRKSRAGKGALIGFLAGALGGAVWGLGNQDSDVWGEGTPLVAGGFAGAIGALSGLLVGSVAGVDSSFSVAGQSEAALSAYWDKLRTYSREGRLPGVKVPSATSNQAKRTLPDPPGRG